MQYENENWAWNELPIFQDDDVFIKCNFVRFAHHTPVFVGLKGLSFLDCNLINCSLPSNSEVDFRCNTSQNAYEFDEWVEEELTDEVSIKETS